MTACAVLSACTSNKITSDEAEQAEKQAAGQVTDQKGNGDTSDKEQNTDSTDQQVTPDNLIDTLTNGSKDAIYNQFTPDMKQAVALEGFKSSADSF